MNSPGHKMALDRRRKNKGYFARRHRLVREVDNKRMVVYVPTASWRTAIIRLICIDGFMSSRKENSDARIDI